VSVRSAVAATFRQRVRRRARGRRLAATTASLVVLAGLGSGASASETQERILDRSFLCTVRGVGSPETVRYLSVLGEPRIARYAPWAHIATTDGQPSPVGGPPSSDSLGAGFRTGRTQHWGAGATWFNIATCSTTRARPVLTSKGLRGGSIARFGESHRCDVPARVVLRVRGVFRSPVTLRPDRNARHYLTALGRMTSASLVVRGANGQPIAYAAVDDRTGRATIFTSPSRCFET
jgi:hypothetical protein